MTKSTKVVSASNTKAKVLAIGTVVVHNYTTFSHGTIVKHLFGNTYEVYFPEDMAPALPKYQANTDEAVLNRIRTITFGTGFFISKHKSFESIRNLQRKYRLSARDVENM